MESRRHCIALDGSGRLGKGGNGSCLIGWLVGLFCQVSVTNSVDVEKWHTFGLSLFCGVDRHVRVHVCTYRSRMKILVDIPYHTRHGLPCHSLH